MLTCYCWFCALLDVLVRVPRGFQDADGLFYALVWGLFGGQGDHQPQNLIFLYIYDTKIYCQSPGNYTYSGHPVGSLITPMHRCRKGFLREGWAQYLVLLCPTFYFNFTGPNTNGWIGCTYGKNGQSSSPVQ